MNWRRRHHHDAWGVVHRTLLRFPGSGDLRSAPYIAACGARTEALDGRVETADPLTCLQCTWMELSNTIVGMFADQPALIEATSEEAMQARERDSLRL